MDVDTSGVGVDTSVWVLTAGSTRLTAWTWTVWVLTCLVWVLTRLVCVLTRLSGVGVDSKINPSDCVDMDCDALKKALLVDADCVC